METLTITVDTKRGSIRADKPLYLAAKYSVTLAGGAASLILSNHNGDPVAETKTEDDATTLELDTAELAKEFRDAGIVACPGCVTLHLWALDENDDTIAQSDIPVFFSPYYTAPTGTLTKIDTQGKPGAQGPRGLPGAGLPTFEVDDGGHLICKSQDPADIYWIGPDGQPDPTKPRWWLSDGTDGTTAGHLYYIVYDEEGDVQARHDLGLVKGDKGDKGDTPDIPDIETEPTPGSSKLVTSGGVAAALDTAANDAANLYIAKSKVAEALAGVGDPTSLTTIAQMKGWMAAMKNAFSALATAIAAALFLSLPARGASTLENLDLTNEVYTAGETAALVAGATNSIHAAKVPLPAADAARGVTLTDPDGNIDQNVAVEIGQGARAGLPDNAASTAADNAELRSAGVAIGANADATAVNADGRKNQGVAVGWNSKAGYNSVAIGGGAQHGSETDMTGHSTYAPGETAVAIGYSTKATNAASVAIGRAAVSLAEGAVQLGAGTNSAANTLKFRDTVIVANGRIAAGTDTNTVARMIREETEKGVMYGSTGVTNAVDEATGETNAWHYIRIEGVNESQGSDPALVVAVSADTNSDVAASFPLFPGSPNRRDIYSAATVDRKIAAATNGIAAVEWLSPWSWPDEWSLSVEASGYTPAISGYVPNGDVYASVTAQGGSLPTSWEAVVTPEACAISGIVDPPEVSVSVDDPYGAVAAVTGNVAYASGSLGQFAFVASDTNGVERRAYVIAAPAPAGTTNELFAMEGDCSERWVWTTNVLARLNSVSTNVGDMVAHVQCRTASNRFDQSGTGTWMAPRALSRFGTGGRNYTNEWPASYEWGGGVANRHWCLKENEDFFWPELRTNLWCYTVNCHESVKPKWNFRAGSAIAVAPHYIVSATHFGSWMWGPGQTWTDSPRFRFGPGTNDVAFCRSPRQIVSKVPGSSDIELCRVTNAIPTQCVAHFAREATLRALSPTFFRGCPGFVITSHQTVAPCRMSPTGFSASWAGMPVGSGRRYKNYIPDDELVGQAPWLEHVTHMFDSASPFFLAAPNGRVVPVGQVYSTGGRSTGGPTYFDDDVLDAIDAAIRLDSGGAEGLSFWEFGDLWSGVGTNSVPEL